MQSWQRCPPPSLWLRKAVGHPLNRLCPPGSRSEWWVAANKMPFDSTLELSLR